MAEEVNYERIAKNPHYKPSEKQVQDMEGRRTEDYEKRLNENIRHSVTVKKHDPYMQKEDDNERPRQNRRVNRGTVSVRENRQANKD